ncbi:hypothetical protein G9A89_020821 [Geosiphon pyriformis]|nr:hypothetical protein G9A89_020821 [Geosiphon pyriformis]
MRVSQLGDVSLELQLSSKSKLEVKQMDLRSSLIYSESCSGDSSNIFENFPFTFTAPQVLKLPPLANFTNNYKEPPQQPVRFELSIERKTRNYFKRHTLSRHPGKKGPLVMAKTQIALDALPTEILINIMEYCESLDNVSCLNKFFHNLVQNKLVLARWSLRQLGRSQALMVTINALWRESEDKSGGLELVKYMVNAGADIFCGDHGMWLLKLLEVKKYRLLECLLDHYKYFFFREPLSQRENEIHNHYVENGDHTINGDEYDSAVDIRVQKTIKEVAHRAVFNDNPAASVIAFLIDKDKAPLTKEEINLAMKFFQFYSSRRGDLDMIRLFLYHRVITIDDDGRAPEYPALLEEAICFQNVHVVDYLIDHGLYHIPHSVQTIRRMLKATQKQGDHILYHLYRRKFFDIQPVPAVEHPSHWHRSQEWIVEKICDIPQTRSLLRFLQNLGGQFMYWTWENNQKEELSHPFNIPIDRRVLIRIIDNHSLDLQISREQIEDIYFEDMYWRKYVRGKGILYLI